MCCSVLQQCVAGVSSVLQEVVGCCSVSAKNRMNHCK